MNTEPGIQQSNLIHVIYQFILKCKNIATIESGWQEQKLLAMM